jgi:hypothetical protein
MKLEMEIVAPNGVSAEVWKYLLSDYLRLQRPAFAQCYRRAEMIAHERGEWPMAALSTCKRHMEKTLAAPFVAAMRGEFSTERLAVQQVATGAVQIGVTDRGFSRGAFVDLYGEACSIQDSSLARIDAIWLGADTNRMHLSRDHVAALLPFLEHFLGTGSIGPLA